ncbi:MAG: RING finger protein [Candidatus Heimdallarchaeaceae archaeon]
MDSFTYLLIIGGIIVGVFVIVIRLYSARRKERYQKSVKSRRNKNYAQFLSNTVNYPLKSTTKTKDMEWLKNEMIVNEENVLRLSMGYQFKIPRGHRYDLFSAIKITRESRRTIKVVGILTKVIPSYLDIRSASSRYGAAKDIFIIYDVDRNLKFFSAAPDMWREIITYSHIKDILQKNVSFIQHYYLRGEYMEATISYDHAVMDILSMTIMIHQGMKKLFGALDSYEIEKLVCYNCQDPFDPLEEICDKCGSPRPRCIVCLLDLYPSDAEKDIVTTPCCGVYAHKDHIMQWLKQNPRCPNCHEDLKHWLGQLQIS